MKICEGFLSGCGLDWGLAMGRTRLVTSNPMDNYLSLREVAARLGISHEAVRRLCHRGTLAHVRRAGRMWVRVDVLAAYRERREAAA